MKKTLWYLSGFVVGIAVLNHKAIIYAIFTCLVTLLVEFLIDEK